MPPLRSLHVVGSTLEFNAFRCEQRQLWRARDLFMRLQRYRRAAAEQHLATPARRVLQALPALLHFNLPSLPGYAGPEVPCGVHHFRLTRDIERLLATVAPAFPQRQLRLTNRPAQIDAIFFIGSAGSVAHTRGSDIDLWVCADATVHGDLQNKLRALEDWAQSQGIDLQAFAVDPEQIREDADRSQDRARSDAPHQASDHAGNQPQNPGYRFSPLLLDEFYRSACWMAGCLPLWWLVPPQLSAAEHVPFTQALVAERRIHPEAWLDFGPVQPCTADELMQALIRNLQDFAGSPHKAILKLALLESYAAAGTPTLSTAFKAGVLAEQPDQELDPYVLLASHLEQQFSGHAERRHRLRHAWLSKICQGNRRLGAQNPWHNLAATWGLSDGELRDLRFPWRWGLNRFEQENMGLRAALQDALSFAHSLAEQCVDRLTVRRFVQATDALLPDATQPARFIKPPPGYLSQARVAQLLDSWAIFESGRELMRHPRLVGALLWLHNYGLTIGALSAHAAWREPEFHRLHVLDVALRNTRPLLLINAERQAPPATSAPPDVWRDIPVDLLTDKGEHLWGSCETLREYLLNSPDLRIVQAGDITQMDSGLAIQKRLEQLITNG